MQSGKQYDDVRKILNYKVKTYYKIEQTIIFIAIKLSLRTFECCIQKPTLSPMAQFHTKNFNLFQLHENGIHYIEHKNRKPRRYKLKYWKINSEGEEYKLQVRGPDTSRKGITFAKGELMK